MSPWKELNEQHVSNAKSDLNGKWDRGGTVERCFIVVTRGFARTAGGCAWPLRQGGSASRGETGEDDDAGPRSSSVRARCLQMAGMRDYLRRPASIHQVSGNPKNVISACRAEEVIKSCRGINI
jgi:hypothetical protein